MIGLHSNAMTVFHILVVRPKYINCLDNSPNGISTVWIEMEAYLGGVPRGNGDGERPGGGGGGFLNS